MLGLLGLILPILPTMLVNYLRVKNSVDVKLIDAEMQRRELMQQIYLAQYEHWIAWLPRFVIEMSVAAYIAAVFGSSILHLPQYGPLKMPTDFIWVLTVVVGCMFAQAIGRRFLK